MKASPSPYYPPRAGRLSRFLAEMSRFSERVMGRNYEPIDGMKLFQGIPWLLIPGLMWLQRGRRIIGAGVMASWLALLLIHILTLSPGLASFGAIWGGALHAITATSVVRGMFPASQGGSRILLTTFGVTILSILLYSVVLRQTVNHFILRLTTHGTTYMIRRTDESQNWSQGDWAVYQMDGHGVGMDQVLAGPGDVIRFHSASFDVNGRSFKRVDASMPTDGEMMIGRDSYFIWPVGAHYNYGNLDLAEHLLPLATVRKGDILGRPCRRWLSRTFAFESLKPISNPAEKSPSDS